MTEIPGNIQQWLQELRSGQHTQTSRTLKRNLGGGSVGYCCLGVYVEKVKGKRVAAVAESNSADEGAVKWYNLCEKDLGDLKDEVAIMNDNGNSFDEIANYVENYFGGKELVTRKKKSPS